MATIAEQLKAYISESEFTISQFRDNTRIHVAAEKLLEVAKVLKEKLGFDMLVDVVGIDYLHYPNSKDRYGVAYCFANTNTAQELVVKVGLNDPEPTVSSLYSLYQSADWLEREVFDLFGINFPGHPDLRRILMPEGFESYPLRKDYPLRGQGERHNFATVIRSES